MKIATFNGCSYSEFAVTPSNWNSVRASTRKDWRITYRFYDPVFRHDKNNWGKQISTKGMNDEKDLDRRQEAVRVLLGKEKHLLEVLGYNPITGVYMAPPSDPSQTPAADDQKDEKRLTPEMPLASALLLAVDKCDADINTKRDIKGVIRFFNQSAAMLHMDQLTPGTVRRGMIMDILDNCKNLTYIKNGEVCQKIWNDNQYNVFCKYLSIAYGVLETAEILEYNPIDKIPRKEVIEDIEEKRRILTEEEKKIILPELRKRPRFLRFIRIFYCSSGRISELMRVQGRHVDISGRRFRVLIRKRRKKEWVWKPITDGCYDDWCAAMDGCGSDDYVFSKRQKPGPSKIKPGVITRRWKRIVKDKLGINVDLYTLKHLYNTNLIDEIIEQEMAIQKAVAAAAKRNNHTTTKMTEGVYDVKNAQRKRLMKQGRTDTFE